MKTFFTSYLGTSIKYVRKIFRKTNIFSLLLRFSCETNVDQITLISKDIAIQPVKTLLKVKLQAALYSLQVYQTGTLHTHLFLGFFRVTIFLSKCFEKILKDYTAKVFYQFLESIERSDICMCSTERKF